MKVVGFQQDHSSRSNHNTWEAWEGRGGQVSVMP